ncbi:MAG: ATP-dependent protease, partial [Planctomycetes bacterium]|nr:ATP-dependent protease [Planctomycetota bacterium]
ISVGEHSFGMPARISCRVGVGKNGVLDIESEIEMSGSSYEKGSLILQGFITGRYALEHPLTFTASICIEQSYSYIDGDSASSTGLYVLMSSLGRIPLRQDLAVTGSVDQFGRIQPIGGANEKIEGFFDVCQARGLTGTQGVLIPATNVDDLMLAPRVVDAIAAGNFHVYPIATIDEGMELLCGVVAGQRDANDQWSKGSFNEAIQTNIERLHRLSGEGSDD